MIYLTFIDWLPYALLALVLISMIILYLLFEKKRRQPKVNQQLLDDMIKALGGIKNIINETTEHRRVQIDLVKTDLVDVNVLKDLQISAFLTGKKITLLMNEHSEQLLQHIKSQRKEER